MSTTISPQNLVSLQEACLWATEFLRREISQTNISYLIQYGKVKKYGENGSTQICLDDLKNYYKSFNGQREVQWKKKLGNDLNWALSFDHIREKESTKHIHRLHPYKGKFIPQLVEYFLDDHTDNFKKQSFFQKGDIILDPFSGSGTTLVQANELGMHAIGTDVSKFNCTITDSKLLDYDFDLLIREVNNLKKSIQSFETKNNVEQFEKELLSELCEFNKKHFPSPQFKRDVYTKKINENVFGKEKETEFLKIYNSLVEKYKIKLRQNKNDNFLDKWYIKNTRDEIDFAFEQLKKVKDEKIKRILAIVLSRTIRSCRATTHSDLATLKEPQLTAYYCFKHKKICKPLSRLNIGLHDTQTIQSPDFVNFRKLKQMQIGRQFQRTLARLTFLEKLKNEVQNFLTFCKNKKFAEFFRLHHMSDKLIIMNNTLTRMIYSDLNARTNSKSVRYIKDKEL